MTSELKGEIGFGPAWWPLRALSIVTGFFLVRGLFALASRFLLGFKRTATLRLNDAVLEVRSEYRLLGKVVRETETSAPIAGIAGVRVENRNRYLHILFGFGFLMVGAFIGMQWFVDGLKAGYPYLMLIGAGFVLLGISIDLGLLLFVPRGKGRSRLLLNWGPWRARVEGIEEKEARDFAHEVAKRFSPRKK